MLARSVGECVAVLARRVGECEADLSWKVSAASAMVLASASERAEREREACRLRT